MKLPNNKYTQMAVYYAATVAAFIVGISTFIYRSWVDNNMNDKVRSFINKTFSIISNISDVIVNETTVNVDTKVTKQYSCIQLIQMTDIEKSMVDEMKELIKDQNEKIRNQDDYIKELQRQMADMESREYDC